MKFTSALSTVLVLLPAFVHAIAIPVDATEVQRRSNDGAVSINFNSPLSSKFG